MKNTIYIDEAGRWPFAWPVYVGLILPMKKFDQTFFNDSKKLSTKKREEFYKNIIQLEKQWNLFFASGIADNKEIDKYWISQAIFLAICRGVFLLISKYYNKVLQFKLQNSNFWDDFILDFKIRHFLSLKTFGLNRFQELLKLFDFNFIIDWKIDYGFKKNLNLKMTTIVDGDAKNKNISMASIIAKVERDEFMSKQVKKYPQYKFEKHKWYWTQLHRDLIIKHWISAFHRISFLQNMMINWSIQQIILPSRLKILKIKLKNNLKIDTQKEKLFLHVCCAPDLTYPIKCLQDYFDLYIFWYNPNITEKVEHQKRFKEYEKLLKIHENKFKIFDLDYNPKEFFDFIYTNQKQIWYNFSNYEDFLQEIWRLPEWWKRCNLCYKLRLSKTSEICKKLWLKYWTTTLSISPYKDLDKILEYWKSISVKDDTNFLFFDFRKNNGFKQSLVLCEQFEIRRQKFCGCIYSKK